MKITTLGVSPSFQRLFYSDVSKRGSLSINLQKKGWQGANSPHRGWRITRGGAMLCVCLRFSICLGLCCLCFPLCLKFSSSFRIFLSFSFFSFAYTVSNQ